MADLVGVEKFPERMMRFRALCEMGAAERPLADSFALLTARDYIEFLEDAVERLGRKIEILEDQKSGPSST